MKLIRSILIPFCILVWACTYFNEIRTQSIQDQMFIRPVFYLLIFLFVVNAINDLRHTGHNRPGQSSDGDNRQRKRLIGFMLLIFFYLLLLSHIGFIPASVGFLFLCLLLFGVRAKSTLVLLPVGVSLFLYVLFAVWFGIPLPEGLLQF